MTCRRSGRISGLAWAVAIPLLASAAPAQTWSAELGVGRAAYDLPAQRFSSESLTAQLRHDRRTGWLSVTGGVPLAAEGSTWGALNAGVRPALHGARLSLTADLDATGYGYQARSGEDTGGGFVAAALPGVSARLAAATLGARAGVLHHGFDDGAGDTGSRTLRAVEAFVGTSPAPTLEMLVEARLLQDAETEYPYLGGSLRWARNGREVWGRFGRWTGSELAGSEWGVGLGGEVGNGFSAHALVRQEAADPLFLNVPRQSWSVSLRRAFGRAPARVAVVAPMEEGRVVLRLPARAGEAAPAVAGDFNGWTLAPMTRQGGYWVASLAIASGTYRYAYRRADGTWFVPPDAVNPLDDGMGGVSALLVVP
jgi:hypothetical protein